MLKRLLSSLLITLILFHSIRAFETEASPLTELNIEALMRVKVVPGPRERGQLRNSPIVVLTAREIARSGARTIPEVLRLVPSLPRLHEVNGTCLRIGASKVISSTRAGASPYHPLVLIDGQDACRSGHALPLTISTIERIEVLSLSKAPRNGVINIITKEDPLI